MQFLETNKNIIDSKTQIKQIYHIFEHLNILKQRN